MRKVQLRFTLVGKTNWWERGLPMDFISNVDNQHRYDGVRSLVENQFGSRAVVVIDEDKLRRNTSLYPDFYSAGWFVSQDEDGITELVIVEHGSSMESATKAMLEAVGMVDWNDVASKVDYTCR